MSDSPSTLYYIHDPMCSWCWAYRPVMLQLREKLGVRSFPSLVFEQNQRCVLIPHDYTNYANTLDEIYSYHS